MSLAAETGRGAPAVMWLLALIVAAAIIISALMIFGPRPTDFAGRKRVALTDYHAPDPTGVPAELRSATLLERGEYLTRAADCRVCHTAKDGQAFAGGRAFVLPFGTLYSTNITPDAETGIGNYTDENFLDAVHKGIGRGNTKLYPAMPFASYTYMTDADALAIKAYLFSLKPVRAPASKNTLAFPFNQRVLMGIWSSLFNPDTRYQPNVDRSPEWNRGAYLVEAMEHCGECHTPRNMFFALNNRRKFAGTVQAGWRAYNITPDRLGVGTWSDADLARYLATGHADGCGTAAGPMGEAVDASFRYLKPSDVTAMVSYLRSVADVAAADLAEPKLAPAADSGADNTAVNVDQRGKEIYEGACVGCHGWTGLSSDQPLATLIGTRDVNDPTANNVVQIIIGGAQRHTAADADDMPAFGSTYSDAEIASVANYVTARYGAAASRLNAAQVARLRAEN